MPPPALGQLPEFILTDEQGEPFGLADMRGRVTVVNFFFTSCGSVCPRLSTRMAELQGRLLNMGDSVRLVSISVDPVRDTPEVLNEYGHRYRARKDFWKFLSGDSIEEIEAVVEQGFKVGVDMEENEETGFFDIVHGKRFVLVDQLGRIRGYYRADDEGIQELLTTMGLLANLGPALPEESNEASAVVSHNM